MDRLVNRSNALSSLTLPRTAVVDRTPDDLPLSREMPAPSGARAWRGRLFPIEPRTRRLVYLALALTISAFYLAMLLQFWAPAHGGVDQNGYFVGGRMLAKTGTMAYTPQSPYGFVGAMWVMTEDGRNFPKYPAGLPLLFAAMFWVGGDAWGPWLSNLVSPVCTALAVLGMFFIGRLLAGSFAGILAMLMLGFSQVTLVMANNPNSHAPALAFATWGMFFLLWWWQSGGIVRGLLAGFLIGYAATIRYTESLLVLPIAIAVLAHVPWRHSSGAAIVRWHRAAWLLLIPALATLVGPFVGHAWTLLLLPGLLWLSMHALRHEAAEMDWPRVAMMGSLAAVLSVLALGGLTVPLVALVGASLAYFLLALRWSDLRTSFVPGPSDQPQPTDEPRASYEPRPSGSGQTSSPTNAASPRSRPRLNFLDAARVLLAALILGVLIPFTVHFPGLLHEKEWMAIPIAAAGVVAVVMLFGSRTEDIAASLKAHVPTFGWLVPVGALIAYNLIEMGTLTGYDTTNESDGKAFTLANFLGNWEKVIRQVHDVGLVFVAPLGLLGLLMLFRRSAQAALILLSWLIPGLVVYAAYYWSPERGTAYLRFFLTLFPPLVAGAAYLLWHGVLSDESLGGRPRRSVALPIAAGFIVAVASALGLYRAINGFDNGMRTSQSLESQFHQNLALAELSQAVVDSVPAGSVLFAEPAFIQGALNYLQFAGDWEVFSFDAFSSRAGMRGMRRGGAVETDDPNPLQGRRRQFVADLYRNKTDRDLLEEQRKLIDERLAAGRRVFAVVNNSTRGALDRAVEGQFRTRAIARIGTIDPALPRETRMNQPGADRGNFRRPPGGGGPPPPGGFGDRGRGPGGSSGVTQVVEIVR